MEKTCVLIVEVNYMVNRVLSAGIASEGFCLRRYGKALTNGQINGIM